jgi:hypothetical protein
VFIHPIPLINLLGLVVNIQPIEIDIFAIPGGGLLGNLLCSLSGLLNPLTFLSFLQNIIQFLIAAINNILGNL